MQAIVEAAWITAGATAIAVTGTVAVAISAARNTRRATDSTIKAERRLRILERRANAYQDVVADVIARRAERDRKLFPIAMDDAGNIYTPAELPAYDPQGWADKMGRLITYCSDDVRAAYDRTEKADQSIGVLYRSRAELTERARRISEDDPDDHLARNAIGESLADLQPRMHKTLAQARAMDDKLTLIFHRG